MTTQAVWGAPGRAIFDVETLVHLGAGAALGALGLTSLQSILIAQGAKLAIAAARFGADAVFESDDESRLNAALDVVAQGLGSYAARAIRSRISSSPTDPRNAFSGAAFAPPLMPAPKRATRGANSNGTHVTTSDPKLQFVMV